MKRSRCKLVETIPGDCEILSESATRTPRRQRSRLDLVLSTVPAKGAAELTYRVRVRQ